MENASILVTGGSGIIGAHIIAQLHEKYPQCHLTSFSRHPISYIKSDHVRYIPGDITSKADVASVFETSRPDVVFHTAASNTATSKYVPPAQVRKINVEGTKLLVEEAKRRNVKVFVYTSSPSVVQREGFRDLVRCDETLPMVEQGDPVELYTLTKVSHHESCRCMPRR